MSSAWATADSELPRRAGDAQASSPGSPREDSRAEAGADFNAIPVRVKQGLQVAPALGPRPRILASGFAGSLLRDRSVSAYKNACRSQEMVGVGVRPQTGSKTYKTSTKRGGRRTSSWSLWRMSHEQDPPLSSGAGPL
ncbi:unnamed protein product, partial [Scytosiphon promiscuus]